MHEGTRRSPEDPGGHQKVLRKHDTWQWWPGIPRTSEPALWLPVALLGWSVALETETNQAGFLLQTGTEYHILK